MKWWLSYLDFPAHIEQRSTGTLFKNHAAAATFCHVMLSGLYCFSPVSILYWTTTPASRYTVLLCLPTWYTQKRSVKHTKCNLILENWPQPCHHRRQFCVYLTLSTSSLHSQFWLSVIQFSPSSYPLIPFKSHYSHQLPLCPLSLNILNIFSALNVTKPSLTPTQTKHAKQQFLLFPSFLFHKSRKSLLSHKSVTNTGHSTEEGPNSFCWTR
jgi:hypothetical protein